MATNPPKRGPFKRARGEELPEDLEGEARTAVATAAPRARREPSVTEQPPAATTPPGNGHQPPAATTADGSPFDIQAGGRRLGELLVEANAIQRTQLVEALTQQAASGMRIGQLLAEMGLVN